LRRVAIARALRGSEVSNRDRSRTPAGCGEAANPRPPSPRPTAARRAAAAAGFAPRDLRGHSADGSMRDDRYVAALLLRALYQQFALAERGRTWIRHGTPFDPLRDKQAWRFTLGLRCRPARASLSETEAILAPHDMARPTCAWRHAQAHSVGLNVRASGGAPSACRDRRQPVSPPRHCVRPAASVPHTAGDHDQPDPPCEVRRGPQRAACRGRAAHAG
jgi:hypothetical protein